MEQKLLVILVLLVLLLAGAVISVYFVVKEHDRTTKFDARMQDVVAPVARLPNPADEGMSLTRTVSRLEQIKARAAGLIGVDLQQAETYPIKWWLVPPITLAVDFAILFLD